jgi:hypothetical protein
VLPTDIEQMTYDQVLMLWIDFGQSEPKKISVGEALERGLIEPGPTGVQQALAQAAAEQANQRRQRRRRRRERA